MNPDDTSTLRSLSDAGVSIWLDDLDRNRLTSGSLARLAQESCVRGVTTNPSIFEKAISNGSSEYDNQTAALAAEGFDVDQIIRVLTTDDVRSACDVFEHEWRRTRGADGRVSIEVDPRLADDTAGTIVQARELWDVVDRRNALIKIPATDAGIPAIAATIAAGISVNVTLIFSVDRYQEVVDAYVTGLERAHASGLDLSAIQSVASVFVSRIDTEVDARLKSIGTPDALALVGTAALANSRLVWEAHQGLLAADRWRALAKWGPSVQRPLWASTGVKDPTVDPTKYVVELVAAGCVNTMPEATLEAVAASSQAVVDTLTGTAREASGTWEALEDFGIDRLALCSMLERQAVDKFIESWDALRESVSTSAPRSVSCP